MFNNPYNMFFLSLEIGLKKNNFKMIKNVKTEK
jgi:hypothetical protein